MDKQDIELKKYLETDEGLEFIKKSLDESWMTYEKIEIESVEIVYGECFEIRVLLFNNIFSPAISTLPIPQKFLRKMKLNKLNE